MEEQLMTLSSSDLSESDSSPEQPQKPVIYLPAVIWLELIFYG